MLLKFLNRNILAAASHADAGGFFVAREGYFMALLRYTTVLNSLDMASAVAENRTEPSGKVSAVAESCADPSKWFSAVADAFFTNK